MPRTLLRFICVTFLSLTLISNAWADDGYRLWLRYDKMTNESVRSKYQKTIQALTVEGNSKTLQLAQDEMVRAVSGLLGKNLLINPANYAQGTVLITTRTGAIARNFKFVDRLTTLGEEGYLITTSLVKGKRITIIAGHSDIGALYGAFHFIRLIQTEQSVENLSIESKPKIRYRLLNHWDNLDRTVERGYAGFSLWDWHRLPGYIDDRYYDYARANASLGINGTVLTNVNANARILTPQYLEKVAALANVFRPYGIKVYLTARFSAPMEIGGLKTADPLDATVREWWKAKAEEIYRYVPDFGGFVVKANSEGQPGPQNFKRSHADGANMLAEAVAPKGGIVMWRAFVYDNNVPEDRAKQAYQEFKPLDGSFNKNVMVQVKNGAIDFQPREPFHPLFGAMPSTPLTLELQITQEYLGQATNLVYLAPLFKECLQSDTYSKGEGSTVAKIIDGSLENHSLSAIAGVANIGTDRNWCGHPFAQSNWFAFGRLAWDHTLTSEQIAEEWVRMTLTNHSATVTNLSRMMIESRETVVKYMTPLGLHHIMGWDHHYGPSPWIKDKPRADWTSVYYHQADSLGIGFNRTSTGSNALSQYFPPVVQKFQDPTRCPEEYLLWFHHVPWTFTMKSGRSLWDELCYQYYDGANRVTQMQETWQACKATIDPALHKQVSMLLDVQNQEAKWWRNSCVLYFQTFSHRPIPEGLEKPDKSLKEYQQMEFPFAPGIRPRW